MGSVKVRKVVKITILLKFARSKFVMLENVIKGILGNVDTLDLEGVDSKTPVNMNTKNMLTPMNSWKE